MKHQSEISAKLPRNKGPMLRMALGVFFAITVVVAVIVLIATFDRVEERAFEEPSDERANTVEP